MGGRPGVDRIRQGTQLTAHTLVHPTPNGGQFVGAGRIAIGTLLILQGTLAYGVFATLLNLLTAVTRTPGLVAVLLAAAAAAAILIGCRAGRDRLEAVAAGLAATVRGAGGGNWLIAACVVGLGLRLAWLWLVPAVQTSDPEAYSRLARRLVEVGEYGARDRAFWPPGLPFSLAATMSMLGAHPWIPGLNNLLWFAGTLGAARGLARGMGADAGAPLAAALLALWPTSIFATGLAAKELLLALLLPLAWALYLAADQRGAAAARARTVTAGLVLGAAVLSQPLNLVMLGAFALFEWIRGASASVAARRLTPFALAVAAVVLPWTLRNYVVLGVFAPVSTNAGTVLLNGNNDRATGRYLEPPADLEAMDEVSRDREAKRRAFQWIQQHPVKFASLIPPRLTAAMGETGFGSYWALKRGLRIADWRYAAARASEAGFWLLLLIFSLAALSRARAAGMVPVQALLPGLCLLATLAVLGASESGGRFHVPFVPALAVIAGIGIQARDSSRA